MQYKKPNCLQIAGQPLQQPATSQEKAAEQLASFNLEGNRRADSILLHGGKQKSSQHTHSLRETEEQTASSYKEGNRRATSILLHGGKQKSNQHPPTWRETEGTSILLHGGKQKGNQHPPTWRETEGQPASSYIEGSRRATSILLLRT